MASLGKKLRMKLWKGKEGMRLHPGCSERVGQDGTLGPPWVREQPAPERSWMCYMF